MDDAGRVNPYEHLAFPGTGLLRLVVGERLGAIAGAQTNRLHAPLPNKHLSAERDRDKPRQRVVANTLTLFRNGAVGFIDWLGPRLLEPNFSLIPCANVKRLMNNAINDDYLVCCLTLRTFADQIERAVSA